MSIDPYTLGRLEAELDRGRKHGAYNSTHEALGVILEEFEEFKAEVFQNNTAAAVEEALQVAATALRFCIEFGGDEEKGSDWESRYYSQESM